MTGEWTMDWYDYVRLVVALLALAAMYTLGRSWVQRQSDYSRRLKDFWWAMNAMLLCFLVGSLEQMIRNREETWTLFIGLCATAVTLRAARSKERTLLKSDNGN